MILFDFPRLSQTPHNMAGFVNGSNLVCIKVLNTSSHDCDGKLMAAEMKNTDQNYRNYSRVIHINQNANVINYIKY